MSPHIVSVTSDASSPKEDVLQGSVFAKWIVLAVFAIALLVFLDAPILALAWSEKSFPGFVVEQTLVVTDANGEDWNARQIGVNHPQRVTHLAGRLVNTPEEFDAAISNLSAGTFIGMTTITPDGTQRVYPYIKMMPFPLVDFLRLFWLPYGIGLIYLVIGFWVYRLRGNTASGRAFVLFCVCTAIVNGLLFDLTTTHAGSALWTLAIAQQGGALISLAMLFPEVSAPVKQRPWLRFLPYGISLGLAVWGVVVLYDRINSWAYILAWRFSYIYAVVGILIFLAVMLYRQYTNPSAVARQQARIILWGGGLAFTPIAVWMVGPLFGLWIPWNPAIFLPVLLFFPLAVAVAILRYKLWDIDVIINRTLVYGLLTLILVFVYIATVMGLERIFRALTGKPSEITSVVSTLLIVALFNPLRKNVQTFIDRRFYRSKYDTAKTLDAFGRTLQDQVDLSLLLQRLEPVIWQALMPAQIHTWLHNDEVFRAYSSEEGLPEMKIEYPLSTAEVSERDLFVSFLSNNSGAIDIDTIEIESQVLDGLRHDGVKILVPLITQAELIGWLGLGPRLSGQDYSADDRTLLYRLAVQAAPVVRVAQLVAQRQAEALERERLEQEMRLANRIQLALLPKELPKLENWCVSAHYQPARAVGGDFYDFMSFPDGRLGIFIGDVTDKGVPAALVMATTRTLLRAVAQQEASPGLVLQRVNNLLNQDIPANMFVTCLYAILDPQNGRLQYANAGQNLPFLRTGQGVGQLMATGMPLGLMLDMDYKEKEISLEPGECVLFYSDGLIEAHNPQREMFGSARAKAILRDDAKDSSELIEALLHALHDFTGAGWEQEDDITLVGFKRKTPDK